MSRVKPLWNSPSKVTLPKKNSLEPISNNLLSFRTHFFVFDSRKNNGFLFCLFDWFSFTDIFVWIVTQNAMPFVIFHWTHFHRFIFFTSTFSLSFFVLLSSQISSSNSLSVFFCLQVLNFQILRLYYDTTTSTKKKRTSEMYFPVSINMRPFMNRSHTTSKTPAETNSSQTDQTNPSSQLTNDQKNENDEYTYNLSGLLLHIGPSAYGGLYHSLSNIWIPFEIEFQVRLRLTISNFCSSGHYKAYLRDEV
jgi:hypothetical protein